MVKPHFHALYSSLQLCCEGPRFTSMQEDGCDISHILERREILLSLETGFNFVSAAVVCAILICCYCKSQRSIQESKVCSTQVQTSSTLKNIMYLSVQVKAKRSNQGDYRPFKYQPLCAVKFGHNVRIKSSQEAAKEALQDPAFLAFSKREGDKNAQVLRQVGQFLFSAALWDLPNSRPVHSLMLSSHLFLCPLCLLPPFAVPCKMVLARPDERET